MQRKKVFSIITIACFASIIFIPIGLVLMFYFTDWKKKSKIITGAVMTVLFISVAVLLSRLDAAKSKNVSSEKSAISMEYVSGNGNGEYNIDENGNIPGDVQVTAKGGNDKTDKSKSSGSYTSKNETRELPSTIKKSNNKKQARWLFPLLFFLTMLLIIIIQNIRSMKKRTSYDNPYVDVKKYKLPLDDNSVLPMVHFLKLNTNKGETILYATETNQKDNEGNFVITNERVVIYNKTSTVSYKINELTTASSISDTVMLLTAGNEKNYLFLPDSQMKYALGVIRYAYNKYGN